VAILRLKDLDASRETHPRTFRLHQIFRTERGAERFLAGRQFLVITIVFLIAQLTSFHDVLTFPLTDVTIPPLLKPVISDFFLGFGMAGALIALWFVQLAPQFAANRVPVGFMNVRPVGWLFRIALTAEAIGLTRPGSWLAAAVRPEPQIPGSSKERYVQAVDQYSGLGMTIVSKDRRLGPDTNTFDYSCSASIGAHGVAKIVDKGILVRLNSVRNFRWSGSYRVADESLPDDLLYDNFEDTAGRGGRGRVCARKFVRHLATPLCTAAL
jgi:hypothetical protein